MKSTNICTLDVEQSIIDYLKKDFDVFEGTMGKKIDVSKETSNHDTVQLLLNSVLPENIQEYDVLIQDMHSNLIIPYSERDNTKDYITGYNVSYLLSSYPETLFDPIPYVSFLLSQKLRLQRNRPILKILFQSKKYCVDYQIRNFPEYYNINCSYSNYEHIVDFCIDESVCGKVVKLCANKLSKSLFESLLDECYYEQIFRIPIARKDGENVPDDRFMPLLETETGHVISYLFMDEKVVIIMLPQCKDKLKLLNKVFSEILYPFFSDYFPTIDAASWRHKSAYVLPNQQKIIRKEETLVEKYHSDLAAIEQEKKDNEKQFGFLHTLLTGSGTSLVKAVIEFLGWLGFVNVVDQDTTKGEGDLLEEDIQIDMGEKGLFIIEVKGINGTSTDAECSQIHKIKFRRCEQRDKFDVTALYIVNNERNVEPLKRTMPPFNETQIRDAENDKRGLAYTWQLFNLFFDIENGFISKDEARARLMKNGLVDFTPSCLVPLGSPYKYYKDNTVACLEVENTVIKPRDFFVYQKNGRWYKTAIIGIQEEKNQVDETSTGKYGFELGEAVLRGELYLLRYSN
ncbi:MAG: hypothetical protein GX416_09305 [Bacteroidales bacterium]|nr:hypothetical protein [Bacteroidales bacterium]